MTVAGEKPGGLTETCEPMLTRFPGDEQLPLPCAVLGRRWVSAGPRAL